MHRADQPPGPPKLFTRPILAAILFFLRFLAFAGQASLFGTLRGLGRPPLLWRRGDSENEIPQLVCAVGDVTTLIAKTLAAEDQQPFFVNAARVLGEKADADILRQARRRGYIPVQCDLAVDFIDVLPARTAAAGEGELKLFQRD